MSRVDDINSFKKINLPQSEAVFPKTGKISFFGDYDGEEE